MLLRVLKIIFQIRKLLKLLRNWLRQTVQKFSLQATLKKQQKNLIIFILMFGLAWVRKKTLQNAKKLSLGMTVRAYPTIVNRQEYGYMAGKVCEIGQYPASSAEMLSDVGGEALVSEFQKLGPVIAVRCELEKDENTASGYKWSTKKGGDVVIPPCTLMSVSIETERKAPVDIIIPYIKEKLSFDKRF